MGRNWGKKKKKKIESLREFYQLSFDNDNGSSTRPENWGDKHNGNAV